MICNPQVSGLRSFYLWRIILRFSRLFPHTIFGLMTDRTVATRAYNQYMLHREATLFAVSLTQFL